MAARRPRNRARAVRTDLAAVPAPRRRRFRNQPAVQVARLSLLGTGSPPGVDAGQLLEPGPSSPSSSRRRPAGEVVELVFVFMAAA